METLTSTAAVSSAGHIYNSESHFLTSWSRL